MVERIFLTRAERLRDVGTDDFPLDEMEEVREIDTLDKPIVGARVVSAQLGLSGEIRDTLSVDLTVVEVFRLCVFAFVTIGAKHPDDTPERARRRRAERGWCMRVMDAYIAMMKCPVPDDVDEFVGRLTL